MSTFEEKKTYNQISFRYAKGKSLRSGNEIHSYHEILYYIDGGATFLSADFKETLERGTLLLIPKEMYHKFRIKNQNRYTRLVISFPDTDSLRDLLPCAMSQIRIIRHVNENIAHLLDRMCEVMHPQQHENAAIFLYGAFLALLGEISFDITKATTPTLRKKEELISKCLRFIGENFTSPISIDAMAQQMFVSSSLLFQCFKNELGVSIHKYITEKRLIYARKRILQGESPTKIYQDCGFFDYSSFYKAYKKMFSHAPSEDKKASLP